jgi:two-component system chemotaxis response regulator CheB
MIRVLVVEDSPTVQQFLLHILLSDPEIEIAGTAETGEEALEAVARTCPDVITMDVHMPKMNGFDATRRIMESRPTPIVIVSGTSAVSDANNAFRAMEAGALAVLQRPTGINDPDHKRTAAEMVRTVKLMSEVKVVRRWPQPRPVEISSGVPASMEFKVPPFQTQIRLVTIGASTGGPSALQTILSALPTNFPAPVLVVQHIASGFTRGLADWLAQSSRLPVLIPTCGQAAAPGHVYIAPDGFHMAISPQGRIHLGTEEPENGLRPSVSYLFRSATQAYAANVAAVLLTGMGRDGAWELKMMKERGAVTIAQDRETSVVHGMPGEAIKIGGVSYILPPEQIAIALASLVSENGTSRELTISHSTNNAPQTGDMPLRAEFLGK